MYQARRGRPRLLGEDGPWADYRAVSRVTFTDPEVGVGRAHRAARPASRARRRHRLAKLEESSRGWIHKAGNEGVIKLVADADRGRPGRRHGRGPVRRRGAGRCSRPRCTREIPVATLRTMHFAYPTFHRAIETALDDLGELRRSSV